MTTATIRTKLKISPIYRGALQPCKPLAHSSAPSDPRPRTPTIILSDKKVFEYSKEEIGNYNLRNSKASHLMDDALDAITHWTLQRKHERCISPSQLPTMTKILIVLNC